MNRLAVSLLSVFLVQFFLVPHHLAEAAAAQRPDGLYAVFTTSQGVFTAQLFEKATPNTVKTFVNLAQGVQATIDPATHKSTKKRYFDGIIFHRVVREQMIQAGDPTGVGNYNCGFTIPDELLPGLRFDVSGRLAMANAGQPNSGGCQFFVTVNAMSSWNGTYTIFGAVIDGMDVVNRINGKPVRDERPIDPVKLESVQIERVGAPPALKIKKKH